MKPTGEYIVCDGGCQGNPGKMDYQAFIFPENKRLFVVEYPQGTNNIAEFLSVVDSLRYIKDNDLKISVYSDSTTALAWVRNKKAKSTFKPDRILSEDIIKAEQWLRDNTHAKVLKWESSSWGENPSDFGRK